MTTHANAPDATLRGHGSWSNSGMTAEARRAWAQRTSDGLAAAMVRGEEAAEARAMWPRNVRHELACVRAGLDEVSPRCATAEHLRRLEAQLVAELGGAA